MSLRWLSGRGRPYCSTKILLTPVTAITMPSVIQVPLGFALWDLDDFGWIAGWIPLSNRA